MPPPTRMDEVAGHLGASGGSSFGLPDGDENGTYCHASTRRRPRVVRTEPCCRHDQIAGVGGSSDSSNHAGEIKPMRTLRSPARAFEPVHVRGGAILLLFLL